MRWRTIKYKYVNEPIQEYNKIVCLIYIKKSLNTLQFLKRETQTNPRYRNDGRKTETVIEQYVHRTLVKYAGHIIQSVRGGGADDRDKQMETLIT